MELRGSHISTMKRLFSPCTRLHDLIESQGVLEAPIPEQLQELNLDVSTKEFLSAKRAFTYADLYAILESGDIVVWLTPHTAVIRRGVSVVYSWERLYEGESCCFHFSADGKEIVAMALSSEHLLEICDVVLRLLAVSEVHRVIINRWRSPNGLINNTTLVYFMEQCQSLKAL
jgi:hypothetical protein